MDWNQTHHYTTRARYADTDPMGVVYHGRYLEWFEAARTEMLRDHGLPYKDLENQGFSLPVIKVCCRYHKPVRYDDQAVIQTLLTELNPLKLKLEYRLFVKGDPSLRVEAATWHCFVNSQGRPVRAPKAIHHFFTQLVKT